MLLCENSVRLAKDMTHSVSGTAVPQTKPGPRVRRSAQAIAVLAALLLLATSCSSKSKPSSTPHPPTTTPPSSLQEPCGQSIAPPPTYDHVVVLVEENRTWSGGRTPSVGLGFSATDMPFLHKLATKCTYFANWTETNGTQNSLTQYIGMTSGVFNKKTVNDCTPSDTCMSTDNNIFRQVRSTGGTARTYVEGATEPCSAVGNAAKHIPALYYRGGDDQAACSTEVLPLDKLDPDALPTFAMIVPNLCNDGHDCPNNIVDKWAQDWLAPILDGTDYRKGRTLIAVVYDEDQPVPNLLIAPTAHAGVINGTTGTHAALLKTIEQVLGLPVLNQGQLRSAISLRKPANL